MNYGNYGRDLLLELKRSDEQQQGGGGVSSLPAYNDVAVSNCLDDLSLHVQALNDQVHAARQSAAAAAAAGSSSTIKSTTTSSSSMQVRPSILLQTAAIQRNKRCLLTYHWVRLQRLQQQCYWNEQNRDIRNNSTSSNNKSSTLAPAEHDFLTAYRQLQSNYLENCGGSALSHVVDDLRAHATHPPFSTDRVVVRVVTELDNNNDNAGPIVLPSGQTVHWQAGATHFLLWSDVEDLVRSGMLQVLHQQEET